MVMIDYLNENPEFIKNKKCVDIGCGTGVIGICSFILGSNNVILCDNVEYSVVHENMKLINSENNNNNNNNNSCTFCLYNW